MSSEPHGIQCQYVDVQVFGSEAQALKLQRHLADLCSQALASVIERVLDQHDPPHGVLRIARLDVDAGTVALERMAQDLPFMLARRLDEALAACLSSSTGATGDRPRLLDSTTALDEALACFLRYGTLPATVRLVDGLDFEATLLKSWHLDVSLLSSFTSSAAIAAVVSVLPRPAADLLAALRSSDGLLRLEGQFSRAFLWALMARLAPALLAALQESQRSVRALASGPAMTRGERALSRAALELALNGHSTDLGNPVHQALLLGEPDQAAIAALDALRGNPVDVGRCTEGSVSLAGSNGNRASTPQPMNEHPDREEGIYVDNAGLVLLHPFLPRLFEKLGVSEGERLLQPLRALGLMHFLVAGSNMAPEYALVLPKLLCELSLTAPVDGTVALTGSSCEAAEAMVSAVISHWSALRGTSVDGLRGAFLQRPGKLSQRAGEWLLQVERQTVDILLGELPWGVTAVRLPWMQHILWVEWA